MRRPCTIVTLAATVRVHPGPTVSSHGGHIQMRARLTCLALAVVAAVAFVSADQSDGARTLMEAARKKEVVDGDLKGAIQQYQAIAEKYKSERAVVADALV